MNMLVQDVFPEFAKELKSLLMMEGEEQLASQVQSLEIIDRCRCGEDFCATFYTAAPKRFRDCPEHRNIALNSAIGDLILDVVNNKIMTVEVLYRDEIRSTLLKLIP